MYKSGVTLQRLSWLNKRDSLVIHRAGKNPGTLLFLPITSLANQVNSPLEKSCHFH